MCVRVLSTLCYGFICTMAEASKVALCKLRSRMLVAACGGLGFGFQHPAPRRIQRSGNLLRITVVKKEIQQC